MRSANLMTPEEHEQLLQEIISIYKEHPVTLKDFSEMVGLTYPTLWNIFNRRTKMSNVSAVLIRAFIKSHRNINQTSTNCRQ
jgi:predicted transcriptional regulator